MTRYLGNAFSAGMLAGTSLVEFEVLDIAAARAWVASPGWMSCLGHADTALLVSALLGVDAPMQRVSTELHVGDELLIAQYNGPRLPEGSVALPEGAKIRWILARVVRRPPVVCPWHAAGHSRSDDCANARGTDWADTPCSE